MTTEYNIDVDNATYDDFIAVGFDALGAKFRPLFTVRYGIKPNTVTNWKTKNAVPRWAIVALLDLAELKKLNSDRI